MSMGMKRWSTNTPIDTAAAITITTTAPCQRVSTARGIGTHRFAISTCICPMPITGTGTECMLGCSIRLPGRP